MGTPPAVGAPARVAGALLLLPWLLASPALAAENFEFAALRFEVAGNGAFVDEFDDGLRDAAPTADLFDRGGTRVHESAGTLWFRPADGASASFGEIFVSDQVTCRRPIRRGAGNSDVRAHFRDDRPAEYYAFYGLQIAGVSVAATGAGGTVSLLVEPCDRLRVEDPSLASCGGHAGAAAVVLRLDQTLQAYDLLPPAPIAQGILLRLEIDDATRRVRASYSLDGGASFVPRTSFDTSGSEDPLLDPDDALHVSLGASGRSIAALGALVAGPFGSTIEALDGELYLPAVGSLLVESHNGLVGSLRLASQPSLDLRTSPRTLRLETPSGSLDATAVRIRRPGRRDASSGRPIRDGAAPSATCGSPQDAGCGVPGELPPPILDAIIDLCDHESRQSVRGTPICNLFASTSASPVFDGGPTLAQALSQYLAGSAFAVWLTAVVEGEVYGSFPPLVSLGIDPFDGLPTGFYAAAEFVFDPWNAFGLPGFAPNHNVYQTLASVLTPTQQGAAGCGAYHATSCDGGVPSSAGAATPDPTPAVGGMNPAFADAGALLQSFLPLDPLAIATSAFQFQPGTAGTTPVGCDVTVAGGGGARLPGCRNVSESGYHDVLDGASPSSWSVGFPEGYASPLFGDLRLGPIAHSQGHPFSGQTWRSELAAMSWNLQTNLVLASDPLGERGFDAGRGFLLSAAFRANGCSFAKPQLCSAVRHFASFAATPLPGDPHPFPSRRWLWETGAEYEVTAATGRFARYAGGRVHAFGPTASRVPGLGVEVPLLLVSPLPPDLDGDDVRDEIDRCNGIFDPGQADEDNDLVGDACDNCTRSPNRGQRDTDGDGYGNWCDADFDGNGIVNFADLVEMKRTFFTADPDADLDGSGLVNFVDLARFKALFLAPPGPAVGLD